MAALRCAVTFACKAALGVSNWPGSTALSTSSLDLPRILRFNHQRIILVDVVPDSHSLELCRSEQPQPSLQRAFTHFDTVLAVCHMVRIMRDHCWFCDVGSPRFVAGRSSSVQWLCVVRRLLFPCLQIRSVEPNNAAWTLAREDLQLQSTDPSYATAWWEFTQKHTLFRAIYSSEQDFKDSKACRGLGASGSTEGGLSGVIFFISTTFALADGIICQLKSKDFAPP